MHYHPIFEKCKHDYKETWNNINIFKKKQLLIINYVKIDRKIVNDKHVIANKCNTFFFTNIGPTLVSQINVEGIKSKTVFIR